MKKLPRGYTWRRATPDDVDRVAELTAAVDAAAGGEPTYRRDEILIDWNRPGFDFEQDTWLFEYQGRVAGYGHLSPRGDSDLVLMAWSHPLHDQWALSFSLMSAMEPRARTIAAASRYKRGIAIAFEQEAGLRAAIEAEGFVPDAWFVEMEMTLGGVEIPGPLLPDEVELREFQIGEVRSFYDALVESFEEHWGAGFPPFEEWWRDTQGLENYDPSLSLVAIEGDRIIGVLFSHLADHVGEVHDIGVLKRHRGRGIGEALMLADLRTLRDRGAEKVRLWVDTDNVTKAIRLYEKVGMHVTRRMHFYAKDLA